jgi:hypothetical protein
MCGMGYDVTNGATNTFWASDLLHRLYHVVSDTRQALVNGC